MMQGKDGRRDGRSFWRTNMARATKGERETGGPVISIIGPGMRVVGDCWAEGTIRIEGELQGTIHAAKAVVVGKDGVVRGDLSTQDAVISGRVDGSITAASRLEIQSTAQVDGSIRTPRMQLEEGAVVNADIEMGEVSLDAEGKAKGGATAARPAGAKHAADGAEGDEEEALEGASAP